MEDFLNNFYQACYSSIVSWIEKWERFREINFCELLFSKVSWDILSRKKAKIANFAKVSLAKVSPIKVRLANFSGLATLNVYHHHHHHHCYYYYFRYCHYCYYRLAFLAYYKYKVSVDMIYDKTILIKCRKEINVSFSE